MGGIHNEGVVSLNSENGAVTLTSTGSSVVITKPTANTINLETGPGIGPPAGSNGDIQFNNGGVFGGDSNHKWDNALKFLGIQQTSPQAPLHVVGASGQTVAAPATLTAVLVQDVPVDHPVSASATQVNGPPTLSGPTINFTYIDRVNDAGQFTTQNDGETGYGPAAGYTIQYLVYAYRKVGSIYVANPTPLGLNTFTDNSDSSTYGVDIGGWSTANGFQDGFILVVSSSQYGGTYAVDIGNVTSYSDLGVGSGSFGNLSFVFSSYPSSGAAYNGYVASYNIINGSEYTSPFTIGSNTDANYVDAYLIINATFAAASGYDGTYYEGNAGQYFDVAGASSFDDYGQSGLGTPSSFASIAFPYFDTTPLTESSSGAPTQNDGSGSYTANGSSYSWTIYEYVTNPVTGAKYISSGYSFGTTDNNDGQPFSWGVSFTPGSGTGRIWVNGFGQGQDIGNSASFSDDGTFPSISLPSPLSSYSGNSWSWDAYGEVTSPLTKYSSAATSYAATDTNPTTGFIWLHSWATFGNATSLKVIETVGSRGPGYMYNGVTTASYYEFNTVLGNNVVTPNTVGYLANGSNLNDTYAVYATKTINGTAVWSPSSPTATTTDPNNGLFYTVTLTFGTVSGATYKVKRTRSGPTVVYQTTNTSPFQDDTTVGWASSNTLTPTTAPVTAGIFQRTVSSESDVAVLTLQNNNGGTVANSGLKFEYGSGGGSFAGQITITGAGNLGHYSTSNGFDFGGNVGANTPYVKFRAGQGTSGNIFNPQGSNSSDTQLWGNASALLAHFSSQLNTVFFGVGYPGFSGGDPLSSLAIQPIGSDKALAIVTSSTGSDSDYITIKDTANNTWFDVTRFGKMGLKSAVGSGNLVIGSGINNETQILLKNAALPATPIAGGIEYNSGKFYGTNSTPTRLQILQQLVGSNAGDVWSSDSNGLPVTSNAININTGSGLITFNLQTEFKQNISLDSARNLSMGSGSQIIGNILFSQAIKTANYNISTNDMQVWGSANSFTFTLPTAVSIAGRTLFLGNYGTGVVTLNTTSGQTISGAASGAITLPQYAGLILISNGSNWLIQSSSGAPTGIPGILPVANGGTGNTSYTTNSIPYFDGTKFAENNANFAWVNSTTTLNLGSGIFWGLSNVTVTHSANTGTTQGYSYTHTAGLGNTVTTGSVAPGGGAINLNGGTAGNSSSVFGSGGTGGGINLTAGPGGNYTGSGTIQAFPGTGGSIVMRGGLGGQTTKTTLSGGTGGAIQIIGGNGAATSILTQAGGIGGAGLVACGTGGNGATGGAGGNFAGGAGGGGAGNVTNTSTGNVGGDGGFISLSGGNGGGASNSTISNTSGKGGDCGIGGGSAANILAGAPNPIGARGGHATISGGTATQTTGTSANGGNVYLIPGLGGPLGANGYIVLNGNGSTTRSGTIVGANTAPNSQLDIRPITASTIGHIVQGFTSQTADLLQWRNSSSTVLASIDKLGNFNSAIAQTTYTGSVSGNAVWSMPFQGSSYKKFLINLAALNDAGGTISYPTAFTQMPYIYGDTAAVAVASTNTTTFTIAAAAGVSGNVFVEGY